MNTPKFNTNIIFFLTYISSHHKNPIHQNKVSPWLQMVQELSQHPQEQDPNQSPPPPPSTRSEYHPHPLHPSYLRATKRVLHNKHISTSFRHFIKHLVCTILLPEYDDSLDDLLVRIT
ncbi:hypothetical protein HanIR_Chr17g0886661 [Helianthus annuus]|nr:hypothetical protein HanIR_Chr17g0886661 [Helianthus annuus]